MDLLHMLLSFAQGTITAMLIGFHVLVGGFSAPDQKIIATTPPPVHTTTATSSSQSVIGTSTPPKPKPKTAAKKAVSVASTTPTQKSFPTPPPAPTISAEALNTTTRGALVNIFCLSQGGGGIHSISGSGVFIDSRGVILTNAHIGQYFLLKDYPMQGNIDCTIRVGGPAEPRYRAKLLYLPPQWVTQNASQLIAEQAKGTGENDYAFLAVTSSTGPGSLPSQFPNLPMTNSEPSLGDGTFLAAYPAGFLDAITIEKNLYPTSAYASVKDLFTFSDALTIDLVSVGGTIVSQGGSSGGAVVRPRDGELQGLIVTDTAAQTTAERDLRALTINYIDRSLIAQGQGGISGLLGPALSETLARFASTIAPSEQEAFIAVLESR